MFKVELVINLSHACPLLAYILEIYLRTKNGKKPLGKAPGVCLSACLFFSRGNINIEPLHLNGGSVVPTDMENSQKNNMAVFS